MTNERTPADAERAVLSAIRDRERAVLEAADVYVEAAGSARAERELIAAVLALRSVR